MRKIVIGALANVDAGKTTLAEGLLYKTNTIRKKGRVDHKDSYLDFNNLEKEKGITIFNKEARFTYKDTEFIYIDTPGHIELHEERDRSLKILDAIIFVISSIDTNFNKTKDLFDVLSSCNIPIFVFINKMDIAYDDENKLLTILKDEINPNLIKVNEIDDLVNEDLIDNLDKSLITHEILPTIFGSALKDNNLNDLLDSIIKYTSEKEYIDNLNAYIYKKDKDNYSYIKILSGTLINKMSFDNDNKINEMYHISGLNKELIKEASQGDIVSVKGLIYDVGTYLPSLINDLNITNDNIKIIKSSLDSYILFNKIKSLNNEMPELNISLDKNNVYININGKLKEEIVSKLIKELINEDVTFEVPVIEVIEEEIAIEEVIEDKPYEYKRQEISEEELKRVFNNTYKPKEKILPNNIKKKEEVKKEETPVYKDLLYIIDGYNLMHALDDYKEEDFSIFRDKVIDIVCDFAGYVNAECLLVFDGYKTDSIRNTLITHDNISIVYTKNKQTADEYIERKSKELIKDYKVIVVTSDYLEQIRIFANGASRLSSREFINRYNNFKKDSNKVTYMPNRPLKNIKELLEEDDD